MEEYKINQLILDYLDYMEFDLLKSQNTVKNYKIDLIAFEKYTIMKDRAITEVDEKLLNDYRRYLLHEIDNGNKKGYSPSTVSRKIVALKSFYKYLKNKRKIIITNPTLELTTPKIPKRTPVYLDLREANKLIRTVDKEKNEYLRLRDMAIMLIFINHGLRVEELSKIEINKIKGNSLSVIGKGDKERELVLTDEVLQAIQDYLEVRYDDVDTDILFLSTRRQPMVIRSIQSMVDKYLKKAGLEGYSVHKLRHTAATLMADQDIGIDDIQEILGHEDVSTTKIYKQTTRVKKQRIAEKMNGLITGRTN